MAYADADDLIARFDARDVRDLSSDSGAAAASHSNPQVTACLDDASGEIDAALMQGGSYTVAELAALTGNSLAHLKRITCEIAMRNLMARRPGWNPEMLESIEKKATTLLERLRHGENVFNIDAHKEAGTPTINGPSTVTFENLNLVRDRVQHYYPARRLPYNR